MADLRRIEVMVENAGEAADIAACEPDAEARQRWLEIAESWRVLAERELGQTLGDVPRVQ